jgi:hypothetical protein
VDASGLEDGNYDRGGGTSEGGGHKEGFDRHTNSSRFFEMTV